MTTPEERDRLRLPVWFDELSDKEKLVELLRKALACIDAGRGAIAWSVFGTAKVPRKKGPVMARRYVEECQRDLLEAIEYLRTAARLAE